MKGKITISRDNENIVNIYIQDANSRIQFFHGKMSLEDFTKTVTGQSRIELDFKVNGLENVGLEKEIFPLEFPLPPEAKTGNRTRLARELAHKHCLKGFEPDLYFGRQGSFKHLEDGTIVVCTSQFRYVPAEEIEE